jgi:hypothetical protein
MRNSSDSIGNRTRDLPACSAVPQPTAPPRALSVGTEEKTLTDFLHFFFAVFPYSSDYIWGMFAPFDEDFLVFLPPIQRVTTYTLYYTLFFCLWYCMGVKLGVSS